MHERGQSKRKKSRKVPNRALPENLIVFSFCVRFHFVLLQFSFNIYASLIKLTPSTQAASTTSLPTRDLPPGLLVAFSTCLWPQNVVQHIKVNGKTEPINR